MELLPNLQKSCFIKVQFDRIKSADNVFLILQSPIWHTLLTAETPKAFNTYK